MTNRGFHKKSFYCLKVKHIFYETNSSVGGMIKLYILTMEETQRQNESYEFTFHSDLFFYFYSHRLLVFIMYLTFSYHNYRGEYLSRLYAWKQS